MKIHIAPPAGTLVLVYSLETPTTVSKKSKKELKKAEAMMAKAMKIQAKAEKLSTEAAIMQLTMLRTKRVPDSSDTVNASMPNSSEQAPNSTPVETPHAAPLQATHVNDLPGLMQHLRNHSILYTAIAAAIVLIGVYTGYAIGKRSRPALQAAVPVVATPREKERTKPENAQGSSELPTRVEVLDRWEMPEELLEISSNAFIDADRVACIQDADAIIYTYNLKTRKIENRLTFGKPGDFEALSVVGNTFYALRSDGHLFEVQPSTSGNPSVKEYDLPLGFVNETEPMFYDEPNNRLLVGVKEKDPQSSDYKGVYSFDLKTKTMASKPVMTIPASHEPGENSSSKKKKAVPIKPSEIVLDPKTGDLFVLNGPHAEFLIVSKDGALKQVIQLDKSIFPQPEGMCFSPDGALYISSEGGKKAAGIIARVELR